MKKTNLTQFVSILLPAGNEMNGTNKAYSAAGSDGQFYGLDMSGTVLCRSSKRELVEQHVIASCR